MWADFIGFIGLLAFLSVVSFFLLREIVVCGVKKAVRELKEEEDATGKS
jgi:hypothetical protein